MTLIASVSGIRGTVGGPPGQGLTPVDIVAFCTAYAEMIRESGRGRQVVVGRDARISGPMVGHLVTGTLMACGLDVLDLGLTTTPTLEMMVPRTGSAGGMVLTASHNPAEWNALKLLDHKGCFLDAEQGARILARVRQTQDTDYVGVEALGQYRQDFTALEQHIADILALDLVRTEELRRSGFKVVVDGINSTGAVAVPALLKALGIHEVVVLHEEMHGRFEHNPEPLRQHLDAVCEAVVQHRAHLGIVVDPDVDRLAFVMEDGRLFGEEYTLVAVADYVLAHRPGPTVSNLSSTRALQEVSARYGQPSYRSAVGEVHVVKAMRAHGAVIGGEGNGGVIYPVLHEGRDALVGIALFLSHYEEKGLSMTALRATYPHYEMAKEKFSFDPRQDADGLLRFLSEKYAAWPQDWTDGLKIDMDDSWLHVRKSNTEPILRIYTEAPDQERATALALEVQQMLAAHS